MPQGDTLRVNLTNLGADGAIETNMHFHGFHVSPAPGQVDPPAPSAPCSGMLSRDIDRPWREMKARVSFGAERRYARAIAMEKGGGEWGKGEGKGRREEGEEGRCGG
jgi:hypothetical protein